MQFLIDDDFDVQTRADLMRGIQVSEVSRPKAESMAQEQMIGYLRPRGYNVTAIFEATGVDRNPLIIMYLIDLLLYHLYSNSATRVMSPIRKDRFEAALDWLKKVNAGDLDPTLPKVESETSVPTMTLGGNRKYSRNW